MRAWIKTNFPKIRWIKSGDGHEDPILTMLWIGFIVVIFRVAVNDLTITVFHQSLSFKTIDPLVIGAVFGPLLTAFVANHYNNMRNNPFYLKMKKDINGDGVEEEILVPKDGDKPA
jgi:hypothetical protein